MRYYTVGEAIAFNNIFYDANDVETTPSSASLTVVYPTLGPAGNLLSQDPGQLKAVQTLPMTLQPDGQTWNANWDSSVSTNGQVYYCMVGGGIVEEGVIVLRANMATLQAFPQPT